LSSIAAITVLVAAASVARPRPCAAQMQYTASARNVSLKLTMPEGLKAKAALIFTVRGLASGWAASQGFKDLAKRMDAVIITVSGGDDLNDNSYPNRCASGEFNGIGEAMTKLAMMSNHPELANVPLVTIGHSHGGDYWNWYNACHPEKVAMVFVHASGGVNYSAASLRTPVLYELGTGDLIENGSKKPRAGMFVNRGKGAPMALVIGQGEGHNNVSAASLAMVIELIEATVKLRIPAEADPAAGPVKLRDIREDSGAYWLGNLYTKEIAPYNMYMGNKAHTAFLPSEEIAKKWKETGPGLPTSIMLPTDTCGWCGNPKDEPKAAPLTDPPPAMTTPDAGVPPAGTDAGAPPVMATADAGAKPATPTPERKDAGTKMEPPPQEEPEPTEPPRSAGGCSVGGAAPLGAPLLLGLALVALARRRRR
jgi:MYXO-CTERM domain-containing protein